MRQLIITLALFTVVPGCVYSSAMKRGEEALASQDYDRARLAYGFALDVKDDNPAATEGLRKAKEGWIEARLSEATAAAGRGEHAKADRMLSEVELLEPEAKGLADARTAAQGSLLAELEGQMAKLDDQMRETYEFAAMAKNLYPGLPETNEAIGTARDAVKAKAEAQLEAKEYAEAQATAAMIAEIEPGYAGVAEQLDDKITLAWADALVAEAEKVDRNEPGLAAVLYARAFELRARPEDKEASKAMWDEAAEDAPLIVFVEDQGGGGRPYRLRKALREKVEDDVGVVPGWSSKWELKAKIYARDVRCRETKEAEPLTKDYISGQKEVENPEHTAQVAVTDAAEEKEAAARAEVERITPLAEAATAEKERIEQELASSQAEVKATTDLLAQTTGQRDSAKAEITKLETELTAIPEEAAKSREEMAARIEKQKGLLQEWEDRVIRDETALAEFKADAAALEAELAKAAPKAQKLNAELDEATATLEAAEKAHTDAKATLANLSPTLMEDIPATLEYDKLTWTNTCTGNTTVYMAGRWDHDLESPVKFEVVTSSTDTSIEGHEKAEVEADPKEYPKAENVLVDEVDAQTLTKLEELMATWEENHFQTTITTAFEEGDTDALVRIFAGVRERMTAEQRKAFREHIANAHGLKDFSKLDDRPPLAEAEPAAEEGEAAEGEAAEGEAAEGEAAEGAKTATEKGEEKLEEAAAETEEAAKDGSEAAGKEAADKAKDAEGGAEEGDDSPWN